MSFITRTLNTAGDQAANFFQAHQTTSAIFKPIANRIVTPALRLAGQEEFIEPFLEKAGLADKPYEVRPFEPRYPNRYDTGGT